MREIKFRGSQVDNGKWVYGYFVKHLPYTPSAIMSEKESESIEYDYEYYIIKDGFSDWNMPSNTENIKVYPETVGQYTGLHDKNGKEIYEGDIFHFSFGIPIVSVYAQVVFRNSGFYVLTPEHTPRQMLVDDFLKCIPDAYIIGNIHENPELLNER